MNPPPPIPHEDGLATPTASAVAAAASTALPPAFRILTPASAASGCSAATIPCFAMTAAADPAVASASHSPITMHSVVFQIWFIVSTSALPRTPSARSRGITRSVRVVQLLTALVIQGKDRGILRDDLTERLD